MRGDKATKGWVLGGWPPLLNSHTNVKTVNENYIKVKQNYYKKLEQPLIAMIQRRLDHETTDTPWLMNKLVSWSPLFSIFHFL